MAPRRGPTASHTYATAGVKTISLTVTDGRGGTNATTPGLHRCCRPGPVGADGRERSETPLAINATTTERFVKILVPAGKTQLKAVTTGPSCGFFSCPIDADLYTRSNVRPTDSLYNCRSNKRGNAETCTTRNPYPGYWYIRVKRYSGAGTVNLTVSLSPVPSSTATKR